MLATVRFVLSIIRSSKTNAMEGHGEMAAVRMAVTILFSWVALTVLLLAPSPLPEHWRRYIYSPASVGLWMLAMLVVPVVACIVKWRWIRSGGK